MKGPQYVLTRDDSTCTIKSSNRQFVNLSTFVQGAVRNGISFALCLLFF